ncbi:MAG: capsule assembly Wzi family protein [Pseudomonadota bacterium]
MAIIVRYLAVVVLGLAWAAPTFAAPWAEPGDGRLRSDLELLIDYGVIEGPVTAWPLPWAQIAAGIERAKESAALPGHLWSAILRIEALMPSEEAFRQPRYETSVMATNRPTLVRDFGDGARSDAEVAMRAERHFSTTYVSLAVGYRSEQRGNDYQFERSYIAQALGNWVVYAGWVEQWWGPGWDSALMFSTNARPFPKIGFKRLEPRPFASKWLSWLGGWQFETFVGLIDERREFSNQLVAGIRLSLEPVKGLSLGFNRALQLCGKDRPCGVGTWFDALVGLGNADNTGTFNEPGNQIAGLDFRYGNRLGKTTFSVYGELIGEDEDNIVIDQISVLGGFSLARPVGDDGAHVRLVAEYSDTFANRSFFGRERPGSTYNNFIYRDGFTYRGRAIGASLDGDSRLVSLTATLTDSRNRLFRAALRRADINGDSAGRNGVSLNREKIAIAELETEIPTRFGDLRVQASLMDDRPDTPGASPLTGGIELGWRVRF